MDKKGVLLKIKELFTTAEKMEAQDYKTQDGRILRVMGGLDVGTEVKELDSEGESDIEDGNYILEDGVVLMIHGGKIAEVTEIANNEEEDEEEMGKMKDKMGDYGDKKEEEEKDKMADYNKEIDTKLVDGTEIRILTKGDAVSVGDMVLVKVGEGYKEAPEGKHEVEGGLVVYTDAEGNINEIETKQTEEKDEEGMAEVFSAINTLVEEVKKLRGELKVIQTENEELKNKFSKFSKEPSTTPTKHEVKFNKLNKDEKLKFFAR